MYFSSFTAFPSLRFEATVGRLQIILFFYYLTRLEDSATLSLIKRNVTSFISLSGSLTIRQFSFDSTLHQLSLRNIEENRRYFPPGEANHERLAERAALRERGVKWRDSTGGSLLSRFHLNRSPLIVPYCLVSVTVNFVSVSSVSFLSTCHQYILFFQ